jgi:hypothetical protein
MIQEFSVYPDWKAPAEDSAVVIWPSPRQILDETTENHRRLAREHSAFIQGIPLAELRQRQRGELKFCDDRPVIASGHQTELFHPGVWAKLAMIDAAARRLDADSFFVAVDSDAPKHLQLRWPGKSLPITDDPRLADAPWCGSLQAPSIAHVHELKSTLSAVAVGWSFKPMIFDFLDDLAEQAPRAPGLSAALTAAMYRLDYSLGLRHQSIVASHLWMSEPYLTLAHHLLAHADQYAAVYNGALGEFRQAHGIHNPGRPMPDLSVSPDRCEVAYWLDHEKNQKRSRACVKKINGQWTLLIDQDAFAFSPTANDSAARLGKFLREHHARLAPRALTLTMFFRLLVVDQFVHGIGGGRYEQVNDRVIQRFFGIDPPAFSVTTGTLYFPTAVGRSRTCVPCIVHEGHRLRHRVMGSEKMELVRRIADLPRGSSERQQVFNEMHNRLATAVHGHPSIQTWATRMSEAARRNTDENGLFDRELFYAIQPRERLTGLIERYAREYGET